MHASQHRQLAREGDRPHRRHGHGAAQVRARVAEGANFLRIVPPCDASRPREHRHLRRPSHGDVLFARRRAGRGAINDPGCVRRRSPTTSRNSRGSRDAADVSDDGRVIAIDGPSASGKGTVAAKVAKALGVSLPRQRRALSPGRAAAIDARATWTTSRCLRAGRRRPWTSISRDGACVARRARCDGRSALRERSARPPRAWRRIPAVRRALLERQRGFRSRSGPGRGRARHGLGGVPRRPSEGVPHSRCLATRAERRYKQLMEKGMYAKMTDVVEESAARRKGHRPSGSAAKALSRRGFSRYAITIEAATDAVRSSSDRAADGG